MRQATFEGNALCRILYDQTAVTPTAQPPNSPATLQPIDPLVDEFRAEMQQRRPKLKPKTIADTLFQIRRLLTLATITTLDQLQKRPILVALEALKKDDPSPVTLNHYIGSIAAFSAKLAEVSLFRDPILPHDPLAGMKRCPIARDRRLIRAAFSPEQFQRLFNATRASTARPYRIDPIDRAAAYLCAISTGMRKSEIRTLTARECRLFEDDPRFELDCSVTKNGLPHIARPSVDAIQFLRNYCRPKMGQATLFRFPKHPCDDVRMLRVDLVAAGLAPHSILEQDSRRVRRDQLDWHSFRVSFVTWLLEKGATVPEVMRAVGHRSERMVMHYARLLEERRQSTPGKLSGMLTIPAA